MDVFIVMTRGIPFAKGYALYFFVYAAVQMEILSKKYRWCEE